MDLIERIKGGITEYSPTQTINDPLLETYDIRLLMKRDDLIHPIVSGNKWRKLRHNLTAALRADHHTLLTFGGAFSNHIVATAFAAKGAGLDSIGVIRGEDDTANPTLIAAREYGMHLVFIGRDEYRNKNEDSFVRALMQQHGRFHLVPEGGANADGVRGCAEILNEVDLDFDLVCCATGTGTTLAGLALGLQRGQRAFGFPAIKGAEGMLMEVRGLMASSGLRTATGREVSPEQISLMCDFHFGGYAKVNVDLLKFIADFKERTGIGLDPVYTGKMMFGIYAMAADGRIARGTTVLTIHTGGMQGWQGMRHRGLLPSSFNMEV
jgi:1-aminocyclopropane-1-carboxylate deaminase